MLLCLSVVLCSLAFFLSISWMIKVMYIFYGIKADVNLSKPSIAVCAWASYPLLSSVVLYTCDCLCTCTITSVQQCLHVPYMYVHAYCEICGIVL